MPTARIRCQCNNTCLHCSATSAPSCSILSTDHQQARAPKRLGVANKSIIKPGHATKKLGSVMFALSPPHTPHANHRVATTTPPDALHFWQHYVSQRQPV